MSVIYKNSLQIIYSKGQKYGIKPTGKGIILPVSFETEGEATDFFREVDEMEGIKKTRISNYDGKTIMVHSGFLGREDICISAENSIKLSLGNLIPGNSMKTIDRVIRYTSLGKKLKEYWISTDKISKEEAQKRLEEITPLADKK